MGSSLEISLAPGFLISMPHLMDPNFSRAVVLMVEHDDDGSFGLILNQPSEMPLSDVFDALEIEWRGGDGEVVWSGGPVMPSSGWMLHDSVEFLAPSRGSIQEALTTAGSLAVTDALTLTTSPQQLAIVAKNPPPRSRFFLGYSGWGPGQLAQEMARGSWLHADLSLDILFSDDADEMWTTALRSIGVDPESIVQGHGVH